MIKQCLICGENFEPLPKGYGRKYCFNCSPSYIKGNNQSRAASITNIRHAIKKALVKYKGGQCEICGYNKCIGALQFHHIDVTIKDFDIAGKYNDGKIDMDQLKAEADKCQLLCANCHAEKHFSYI